MRFNGPGVWPISDICSWVVGVGTLAPFVSVGRKQERKKIKSAFDYISCVVNKEIRAVLAVGRTAQCPAGCLSPRS